MKEAEEVELILEGDPILNVQHVDGRLEMYLHGLPEWENAEPKWVPYSNILAAVIKLLAGRFDIEPEDILVRVEAAVHSKISDVIGSGKPQ